MIIDAMVVKASEDSLTTGTKIYLILPSLMICELLILIIVVSEAFVSLKLRQYVL